jgi:hypothetical protein
MGFLRVIKHGFFKANHCKQRLLLSVSGVQEISNEYGNIHDILHDVFSMHNMLEPMEEGLSIRQPTQEPNKDAHRFYKLLEDAEQPLYKGCKNFSKLSAILHLYHLKCLSGWSNKLFTMLLQILQDLLPLDAKLPKDNYEAKKIIKDLGLGYEKIHACPNDCMLFWKENALDEACLVCGASRWKKSKGEESEMKKVRMEKVRMKFKMIRMLCLRERRKVQRFYGGFP